MTTHTPDLHPAPFGIRSSIHPWRTSAASRLLVDIPLRLGPRLIRRASSADQQRWLRSWSRSLLRAGDVRLEVRGTKHLSTGPFVVASLHESFVDVPVLATLPLNLRFTARGELFDGPDTGPLLRTSHHIRIPEQRTPGSVRQAVEQMRDSTANGDSIVVFPQGSLLGVEVAFQDGFTRIPNLLRLPVLPISIAGTHFVWDYPFDDEVRFGREVVVTIHEPVPARDWTPEIARATERSMKETALATGLARCFRPDRDGWWDDYEYAIDDDFADLALAVDEHRLRRAVGISVEGSTEPNRVTAHP